MQGRLERATDRPLSRRLLPIDAWREPDKWLDLSTGLVKKEMRNRLPYPTDSRGLAQPDIALAELQSLVWDDFVPVINQTDPELKTDNHHLYHPRADYKPENNYDSLIPYLFREQSANLIEMYRPIHNADHDLFGRITMPSQHVMAEELEKNCNTRQIMQLAIYVAQHTIEFQQLFAARRNDIALNPNRIGDREYDEIGEEFLRRKFDARHSHLRDLLGQLETMPYFELFFPNTSIVRKRPAVVVAKLGEVVARRSVDYVDRSLPQAA
jgi:hypothetical protein